MNQSCFSKIIFLLGLQLSSILFTDLSYAQEDAKRDVPSFKMSGDVALLSNYIDHGLTQTNKDPSLQAAFSFNFGPQFRLGLWGSNVNFGSSEHFLLKMNAELRVQLSPTTDFKFAFFDNRYFKSDTRSGNTMQALLSSHGYRIQYEGISNWEGTGGAATNYSFAKIFDVNTSWKWDNQVGYTMLSSDTYSNYFDVRSSFFYKGSNNIIYQISLSGTSSPSQFNGRGDIFPYVGASTSF